MRVALVIAAVYAIASGVLLIASPVAICQWIGAAPPPQPELIQFIGILITSFGIGFGFAAIDPIRYWPLAATGLVAKVGAIAGAASLVSGGRLNWHVAAAAFTGDLLLCVPLSLILQESWRWFLSEPDRVHSPAWQRARTERGETLGDLSFELPILLVALRHNGCPFCKQALSDLSRVRAKIEFGGTRIILAHMGTPDEGLQLSTRYGLENLDRVADPNRLLYHALRLGRGNLDQILGPRVWWKTALAFVTGGHFLGQFRQDIFQMGGLFLLDRGRIVREFHYKDIADRPDFVAFASGRPVSVPAQVRARN